MANSLYQTPNNPRLYVSYPLWQYANGGLDTTFSHQLAHEQMVDLIKLDPSNTTKFSDMVWPSAPNYVELNYFLRPHELIGKPVPKNLWNFNYYMVLNHNLATMNSQTYPEGFVASVPDADGEVTIGGSSGNLYNADIKNCPYQTVCWNDGFSALKLNDANYGNEGFRVIFKSGGIPAGNLPDWFTLEEGLAEGDFNIGSILWGKYFEFPQNCDLNTTLQYDYGTKIKENIAGKSISTGKWNKVDSWYNDSTGGTEPFGLRWPSPPEGYDTSLAYNNSYNIEDDVNDTADSFRRKSGRRVWTISFDSLAPEYVMNQNSMMNSDGWHGTGGTFDNYSTNADGTSTYNIDNGLDFYTSVVHKTNGGQLPMVLQLNKDDASPHNFAIVRMQPDYKITQKLPNLYNIKITLIEQI